MRGSWVAVSVVLAIGSFIAAIGFEYQARADCGGELGDSYDSYSECVRDNNDNFKRMIYVGLGFIGLAIVLGVWRCCKGPPMSSHARAAANDIEMARATV